MSSLRKLLSDLGIEAKAKEQPAEGAHTPSSAKVCAVVLHEEADMHIRDELARKKLEGASRIVLIVGDQTGLTREQVEYLATEFGVMPVTVGATPLLTSHCIVILNHFLDELWPAQLAVAGETPEVADQEDS